MQEEVENRAVTLVISATKLTGRLLKAAILKYLVFFKARDADALTAAFREYTAKEVKRASQDKPSVLEQLRAFKAKVLSLTPDKARNKDKGLEL